MGKFNKNRIKHINKTMLIKIYASFEMNRENF